LTGIINMGRTKSRPRPLKKQRKFLGLPTSKQRLEKTNIYKLCVSKLARIDDPQAKLCKAVLINNTLKKLEKQPDYLFNESENYTPSHEVINSNSNIISQPSLESICSHFLRNNNSRVDHLHDRTVPKMSCDIQDMDTLSMCDDIINEFLGVPNASEADCHVPPSCDITSSKEQNKENFDQSTKSDKERGPEIGGSIVSPYSYSSFLSEVYTLTLRKMKHKVDL